MSLNIKLTSTICAFFLILGLVVAGVFAVPLATVNLGGTLTFSAKDVYARITGEVAGAKENPILDIIEFNAGSSSQTESWNNDLEFKDDGSAITFNITIENMALDRPLYAKVSDSVGKVNNVSKVIKYEEQEYSGYYIEIPAKSDEGLNIITFNISMEITDKNLSLQPGINYGYSIDLRNDKAQEVTDITNLFEFTDGQALFAETTNLGTINSSSVFATSNYVDVSEFRGKVLNITMPVYTLSNGDRPYYGLCFYDSNQNVLESSAYRMNIGENSVEIAGVEIPNDAKYVITTYYASNYTNYDYDKAFSAKVLSSLITKEEEITYKFSFTDGKALVADGSELGLIYDSSVFAKSNYVDVSDYIGETLMITMPIYTSNSGGRVFYGLCFYDLNKNIIKENTYQMLLGERSVEIAQIKIPINATYVVTTYYGSNFSGYNYEGDFFAKIVNSNNQKGVAIRELSSDYVKDLSIIYNNDDCCDYYYISSVSGSAFVGNYSCTSFIDCKDAESMDITLMQIEEDQDIGISFFDSNKALIAGAKMFIGGEKASIKKNIVIPENAAYFKTSYFNYEDRKLYGDFSCTIYYPTDSQQYSEKRNYQNNLIFFSQEVNQSISSQEEDMKVTTGVLALPETYKSAGKSTPLIIYFHGYSHYVYYGNWGSTDTFKQQKQNFVKNGFAVMDCNGARNNDRKSGFTSAGSEQWVNAYKKCLDYVLENYNIDANNVYVVGGSAGGPAAINFCYTHMNDVKALILISTWTDLYKCEWGQGIKSSFVEYLGFADTETYESEKAQNYDPANHIKKNENSEEYIDDLNIPVYGFIGSTESGSISYDCFIRYMNALIKGNPNAQIKIWEGLGHEIVSGAVTEIDNAITEYFSQFIES